MTHTSLTLFALFLGLCAPAHADSALPTLLFEFGYMGSSVSPSDLNSARQAFYWNGTTPGQGSFKSLAGFGGSIGYQFIDGVYFLLHMKQLTQSLGAMSVGGTSYSETESFEYDPIYLMVDMPFPVYNWLTLSLRGGVGYAYRFELRQQNNGGNNELVVWGANPIPLQLGGTANFSYFDNFGLYVGTHYEYVKSSLKALGNYQTTVSGQPISSGTTYSNISTGSPVTANLSGFYYEAGLRVAF